MREKFHLRLDGVAVTRVTLDEINKGALERAELATTWRAEVESAKKLELGMVSSQAAIVRKILERGRITLLSQKLEAQILKIVGQTGDPDDLAEAIQFAHQVQLLMTYLQCSLTIVVEKDRASTWRKVASAALEDLQELDLAIAELYGMSPLWQKIRIAVADDDGGAGTVARIQEDDGVEPVVVDLCLGTENLRCCQRPEKSIRFLLNYIFGFPDFRPSQIDSIIRILQGKDTIALLPTGSGKSIIFQMLALIRPGFGLVIAPIVSLIHDQVDNLLRRGIDRVAGVTASTSDKSAIMQQVKNGQILLLYVSPERLQIQNFQDTLSELGKSRNFSILAIDEAHCVSEWGHDFRTSYLNLASICRRVAPKSPLLALTGTASARILQEMCVDLGMGAEAVQRPKQFDRPELHFDVIRTSTAEKPVVLRRILTELLPQKFGMSPTEFYRLQEKETMSGVIFCPHVSGDYGVATVRKIVQSLGLVVTEYFGQGHGAGWAVQKQDNAAKFKDNHVPLLVATKSFGMGVDKPNIRYVIHYCPPASIEAYYQEAGRGGRDRETAWSFVILSNDHERRNAELLSVEKSYADFVKSIKGETSPVRKKLGQVAARAKEKICETLQIELTEVERDDIDLLLYFHLHNFVGPETELKLAEDLLKKLQVQERAKIEISPERGQEGTIERSIYRLQKAGYIQDYRVDFRSNSYQIKPSKLSKAELVRSREKLQSDIAAVYKEVEPTRRGAIAKIIEIMTTAGKMVDSAEKDDYLRREMINYLTSV